MSDYTTNDMTGPIESGGPEESNVHYLPARRTDQANRSAIEPAGPVLEGEIITVQEYNARQKAAAIERYKGYRRDAVTVYRGAKTVVTHQRTKAVVRHLFGYPLAGAGIVWRRWQDAHGVGRYERQMRAAEMAGDQDALRYWQEANVQEKQRRHDRVMDWVSYLNPWLWIKYGTLACLGFSLFLLVIGVITAINTGEFADVLGPITAVLDAVAFVVWFLATYGALMVTGGTVATLLYLYGQGRRHGDVPEWLQAKTPASSTVDSAVDESMIMNALRNLQHPALNKKFKEGWGSTVQPIWVQPPLPVGHGWEFALRLPGGVPATSINARKSVLAHNLGRRPEEVWVEVEDTDPMAMKALVLDPGSLREPVPDYPLLESLSDAQTDFWTGFPVGIDARWNEVVTPVFERNFVKAGIMGSGKSTLIQNELAGAVLDPVVDIDVFCFAENNDFEWLRPVASIFMGDTAENVDACMNHIHQLKDSLAERGQLLREYGINSVTREAAEADDRLRPRFVVIDECQSFFRQDKPEDRRELVNLVVRFYSAARKYGIVLCFATPTPSDQSLPRDLVAVTTNKACFAIGDKTRNNVVLGEKAYENGLSALELKPAVKKAGKIVALNDVGTCVAVGFTDQPGLLRSYNLTDQQKAAIVARGVELRGGRTRRLVAAVEQRDLLADVAAVLAPGEDKAKATDVCARLREHAPHHHPYLTLTAEALRDQLAAHGCKVTKVGVLMVFTDRVHAALTAREGGNG
jgi:DNA segregation ATPase FtsK/SpoIIIE, S-DNA-T family